MADPVYKVFLMKPTSQAYQTTEEQRIEMLAQMDDFMKKIGGRRILQADMS